MSVKDLREACRRLALPRPWDLTVNQAQEARECTGCTAHYERGMRVVHIRKGCPVHGRDGGPR